MCHGGFSVELLCADDFVDAHFGETLPVALGLGKMLAAAQFENADFLAAALRTTVAFTVAPLTNGAPTLTPSPSPSMRTRSKDTVAPISAASNSTLTCSPDLTRYCLPPVWITAYMAGPVLK